MRYLRVISILTVLILAMSIQAGAGAATPADIPEDAIPLGDGAYAVELKAETPDWYTDELHQQVLAAGKRGVPVPEEAGPEFSSLAFTGIRPGAWMFAPAWCTMNFVFGSEGSYHIGTAGHCTSAGEEVVMIALPGVLMNVGTTVKSYDNGIGEDFALIDIYDEMQEFVNPSMSYFGGPTGTAQPALGDVVLHSGHGLAIGTGGTPRAGVVTYVGPGDFEGGGGSGGGEEGGNGGGNGNGNGKNCEKKPENCDRAALLSSLAPSGDTAYGWDGAANLGDSGSGVRDATGTAAGNLTHLVVGTQYLPAFIVGTTAPYMEQLAGMPIATASLVPDPLW
jgi:hypothetical protein